MATNQNHDNHIDQVFRFVTKGSILRGGSCTCDADVRLVQDSPPEPAN